MSPHPQLELDFTITTLALVEGWPLLDYHPFCLMLPRMNDAEFEDLKADIKVAKQRDPILLFDGKILDGRHRYMALKELNVTPRFEEFEGTDSAALNHVVSKNLKRRHLTSSQRAAIAVEMTPVLEALRGEAHERMVNPLENFPEEEKGTIAQKVAALNDTNEKYVRDAEKLKVDDPELFDRVKDGKLNLHQVKILQEAPLDEKEKALKRIDAGANALPVMREVKKAVHPATQGGNDQYNTPEFVIDAVRVVLGGIDLDPFSNHAAQKTIGATNYFTIEDDAFNQPWSGKRLFMNPPFSDNKKCAYAWVDHFKSGDGEEGIVLNKLDWRTEWTDIYKANSDAFAIHRGPFTFEGQNNLAPFSVIYFYYGPDVDRFIEVFSQFADAYPTDLESYLLDKLDDGVKPAHLAIAQAKDTADETSSPDQRLQVGQAVQVCQSLKLTAIAQFNLPPKTEQGEVLSVGKETCEVRWQTHDPAIQTVKKKYLCHSSTCKPQTDLSVGDRVAFAPKPELVGTVAKIMSKTARVVFDDPKLANKQRSTTAITTAKVPTHNVQKSLLDRV